MPRPAGHGPKFEVRRQEIIDIAAELFARNGYTATGILDLCRATGLAKGALYYYISSKENLLIEIQSSVITPLLQTVRRLSDLNADALVRLRLVSQALLTVILERLNHIWVYEHDYRHLTAPNRARFMRDRREFEKVIADILAEGMAAGQLREMDVRLATLQFLNLHNHTYTWVHADGRWDAATLSREYCQTLASGFAVEPGVTRAVERRVASILSANPGLVRRAG